MGPPLTVSQAITMIGGRAMTARPARPPEFAATQKNTSASGAINTRFADCKLNYKSAEKYVGSDEFELLVLWPTGFDWEVHYDISVR
jgi:hypothetical protein